MDKNNDNKEIKLLADPRANITALLSEPQNNNETRTAYLVQRLRMRQDRYIEGILKGGTLGAAMEHAGIKSRQTIVNWRLNDPGFAERENDAITEAQAMILDIAERGLYAHIKAHNLKAIMYVLDRLNERYKPKGDIGIVNQKEVEQNRNTIQELISYVKTTAPQITPGDERGDD